MIGPLRRRIELCLDRSAKTLTQGTWPFNLKVKVGSDPTPGQSRFQ
jgi:hypothetical protein